MEFNTILIEALDIINIIYGSLNINHKVLISRKQHEVCSMYNKQISRDNFKFFQPSETSKSTCNQPIYSNKQLTSIHMRVLINESLKASNPC